MEAEEDGDLIYVGEEHGVEHGDDLEEQDKEEYYDDGVGIEGQEGIEVEPEGDLAEEAYEIRDEEDINEENAEEVEKEATGTDEKSAEEKGAKDDGMLVVDEWDNEDVEAISDEGVLRIFYRTVLFFCMIMLQV
jgi:hypothetical protein